MGLDFSKMRVAEISRIVKVNIKSGNGKQMINRSSEGIIVVLNGELEYFHNNQIFVSSPAKILFVPRGISYTFKSITDSTSIVINFDLANKLEAETFYTIRGENSEFASKMEKLWAFRKEGYMLSCLSILYNFLAKLCAESVYIPVSKLKMIQPGIHYMEEHLFDNSLRDDDIANVCKISKTYFRTIFQNKYSVPPMKYVRQKRIERAKQVFDLGYYSSIWDVALESGFSDIYTFSKVFKRETGMSPTEYIHFSGR